MEKGCGSKCAFTATVDSNGNRLMVSMPGNSKFASNILHPRCESCADKELAHGKLMVLFGNDADLVRKYEELTKKKQD